MRQRLTSFRDRLLSALALALCILLLAIIVTTFPSSISTTVAPDPPESAPTSSISLIALLYQFLNSVLALFGITLDPSSGQFSGVSIFGLVFTILQTIYQHRLPIITSIVLLTVLGLLYQYRHHLAVPRILQSASETAETATQSATTGATSTDWPPDPDPDSVQKAWVVMVRRVDDDVEAPSSRTPSEWQEIAVAAGLPTDAVKTITSTFCAVQYGNATETDTHRRRVRDALNALDINQGAKNE